VIDPQNGECPSDIQFCGWSGRQDSNLRPSAPKPAEQMGYPRK
jgi:hypothetical protein